MSTCKVIAAVAVCLALLTAGQAHANTTTGNGWQFTLAPLFLWGVSAKGSVQAGPETTPLKLEFQDDTLENLEAVLTWHFEAQKNNLSLFVEHQYIDLVPTTLLPTGDAVSVGFKNTMFELDRPISTVICRKKDLQTGTRQFTGVDFSIRGFGLLRDCRKRASRLDG